METIRTSNLTRGQKYLAIEIVKTLNLTEKQSIEWIKKFRKWLDSIPDDDIY